MLKRAMVLLAGGMSSDAKRLACVGKRGKGRKGEDRYLAWLKSELEAMTRAGMRRDGGRIEQRCPAIV
ncbi:hypothetical protein AA102526_1641 [Asaia lannensis NBRC 102526]|nr:hypothetical protein AA102526_1641 [Asaia lannensis NBRC 102526]